MFHEVVDDPGDHDVEELYARYEEELVDAIEAVGVAAVAASSEVDETTVQAVLDGEAPELTLEEAGSVLATLPDAPSAGDIEALARDALLMGMTNAVLDVEAVESAVDGELEAKEIQSKVEGRFPMTLREFALLHHHIDRHAP
jgi:hypothetical protein